MINGEDQRCEPWGSSYTAVLEGLRQMHTEISADELMTGVYPNPAFARYTYQLSSVLWRASRDGEEIVLPDADSLLAFDARFAEEAPKFSHYGSV